MTDRNETVLPKGDHNAMAAACQRDGYTDWGRRKAFFAGWERCNQWRNAIKDENETEQAKDEPAWMAELRRLNDEKARTELAVLADKCFWNATAALKAGEPSVRAMRYAIDAVIESLK